MPREDAQPELVKSPAPKTAPQESMPTAKQTPSEAKAAPMPGSDGVAETKAAEKEPETELSHSQLATIYTLSSMSQGAISTLLLNPFYRALYLAQVHHRPYWLRVNFVSPYQGSGQAAVLKCVFGSTYYIAQDEGRTHLFPFFNDLLGPVPANIFVGLFAGTVNGIIRHPTDAVKYQAWGVDNATYLQTGKEMWKGGKAAPFICGMGATIFRDSAFGGVYEVTRFGLNQVFKPQQPAQPKPALKSKPQLLSAEFARDLASGTTATVFSTLFNYARNKQFHLMHEILQKKAPLQPVPGMIPLIRQLNQESKVEGPKFRFAGFSQFKFFCQKNGIPLDGKAGAILQRTENTFTDKLGRLGFLAKKCKVGGGTLVSGFSMAVGQVLYNEAKEFFTTHLTPKPGRK